MEAPSEPREARVQRLALYLFRLQAEFYEPLAKTSCGPIDPHEKVRWEQAVRLAKMLIPR